MSEATPSSPAAPEPALQRQRASQLLQALREELQKAVIGQQAVIDDLLTALIANGHVLVEGVPGLGKTLLVRALARCFGGDFARIQFTPDLMPSDVTGHAVYDLASERFKLRKGPVFTHLLLADEINRAPAKTQSALLEVMQERQVTLEGRALPVPQPFLVMATQNPIEQEGTYPLPEAQMDRFLMHVNVDYPAADAEAEIIRLARAEEEPDTHQGGAGRSETRMSPATVFDARRQIHEIKVSEPVERYIVALVQATRDPARLDDDLKRWIEVGVSPRGSIGLDKVARAIAWLRGRDYVTPEDVQAVVHDVFRHRLILSYDAHAAGVSANAVIDRLVQRVAVA